MEKLNKAQAQALFEEHAILIGGRDAIPEETAVEFFGEEAVAHAHTLNGQSYELCNVYGIGHYQQGYLTLQGFLTACTYSNVHELEREKAEREREPESEDIRLAIVGLYLQYMEQAAEGLDATDKAAEERLLAALETATGAKPEGLLAKVFLAYAAGLDKGLAWARAQAGSEG